MQWIKDALELLAPGWVGSLIGFAGIVAAAITYFLTRQRTRFAYRFAGDRLLGLSSDGLPSEITVQYHGKGIERLTRSLIVFWNSGEKTILAEDIVAADPLRLIFGDDGFILSAIVLKQSREVTECSAVPHPKRINEVELKFSFLDSGDGAVVEILHTSEKRYPEIQGTVRGLPTGLKDFGRITARRSILKSIRVLSPRKIGWIAFTTGGIGIPVGFLIPSSMLEKLNFSSVPTNVGVAVAGAGAFYAMLGLILLFITRRRYPKSLHVDELGQ